MRPKLSLENQHHQRGVPLCSTEEDESLYSNLFGSFRFMTHLPGAKFFEGGEGAVGLRGAYGRGSEVIPRMYVEQSPLRTTFVEIPT